MGTETVIEGWRDEKQWEKQMIEGHRDYKGDALLIGGMHDIKDTIVISGGDHGWVAGVKSGIWPPGGEGDVI